MNGRSLRSHRLALFALCSWTLACEASHANEAGSELDGSHAGNTSDGGGGAGDGGSNAGDAGEGGSLVPTGSDCKPLGAPAGATVTVSPSQADELASIVSDAAPNTTILLEDGTYRTNASGEENRRLIFRAPGVTLRSKSGNAAAVILDGEYQTNELLYIVASHVTIAELTLRHAVDHLVHVTSEDSDAVTGTRLVGLRLLDSGEQFVKINSGSLEGWPDQGEIACSSFRMTADGRTHVERAVNGCYTGGIDAHAARAWIVHDNTFEGIYCAGEGLAEHAVHFWRSSRDTVVENNHIIDCARGIGFGLDDNEESRVYSDDPYSGIRPIAHFDGIIRNNVIWADIDYFDTGIELHNARGARVLHNTVVSSEDAAGFFSSIDYRFSTTQVELSNNLTTRITARNDASAELTGNLEATPLSSFVSVSALDFHLAPSATDAIDHGVVVDDAGLDLDGQAHDRGAAPDIGADER